MKHFSGIYQATPSLYPQAAPCLYLGRHRLSGEGVAQDAGVAALCAGFLRDGAALRRVLMPDRRVATDSELLLHAYLRWGEACVDHLAGPGALIVLDQGKNRLLLARDRMGEIPVFFARRGESLCFASHPEALLTMGIPAELDEDGLRELFGLGPARTPGRTPLRGIEALKPGELLLSEGDSVRRRRYFALQALPHEDSPEATLRRVRDLVEQAVADVALRQPASMLSGGLDSTVLTALLARQSERPVETFSVDYEQNADFFQGGSSYQPEQDAPYVEMAREALGTRHERVVLTVDQVEGALTDAMAARGFPGMADIDSSLYLFARAIARTHRCVLSGECGDEVFGGYPWFHRPSLIEGNGFPWSGSLSLREAVLRPDLARALNLSEYVKDTCDAACAGLPTLPGEDPSEARLRQLQGLCFEFFMPNLQERACAMCAASGLQVLTPFCDERLVQYVYNVPWALKNTGGTEKGLLRAAMAGLLPEALLSRRKSPYPKTYHPDYARRVKGRLAALLANHESPLCALVDAKALTRLMNGPLSPQETPWFGQLMAGPQMLAYLIQVNDWMARCRVRCTAS